MTFRLRNNKLKYILIGFILSSIFWICIISRFIITQERTIKGDEGEGRISNDLLQLESKSKEEKDKIGIIKNEEDLKERDEGYAKFAFNSLVSNRIGYHRSLPDTRHELCKSKKSIVAEDHLPKASVVICFHNEAESTLMRTIYSVIDRTPEFLLHEIVLLDDNSDKGIWHDKFISYFKKNLLKIKFHRTNTRQGLIRGRIEAARKASGEVLVFLDSHCEVNQGWLPPLLTRIAEDKTRVLCPMIDIINSDTFEYSASPMVKGGFNWGLHFSWEQLPEKDLKNPNTFTTPFRSPTMAGGLFAIDRKYFFKLGAYDDGMDIWGGENLEISFRIWMCGGSLEFHPCSRVGHVFRNRRPYGSAGKGDTMGFNSQRVAEVWMDKYKMHFYNVRTDLRGNEFGDVSSRKALRKNLKCKSFKWFLDRVYPEIDIPLERTGAPFIRNFDNQKKAKTLYKTKVGGYKIFVVVDINSLISLQREIIQLETV